MYGDTDEGIKILHVDDESFFLDSTKAFLERRNENFCVDTAHSAEEGLELIKNGKYDVILSDYQMPGMDGLEFLQDLRDSGNTIPFIIFTGKGREEVAMEALNRGANHYLQKGGDPKSLFGTLAHVIQEEVEKKRTEDALRESEEKYRTIIEHTGTGMCIIEEDNTLSFVNKEYEKITGYKKKEVVGKVRWTEHVVKEDLERMEKRYKQRVSSGGKPPSTYEFRLITKGGDIKDILLNVNLIPGTNKRLTSLIDITERKKAERELRESEEKYRSLVESTEDSVYLIDNNCRYLFANEQHLSRLGLSEDQVIGRAYGELHLGEKTEEFVEYVGKVFKTGKAARHEHISRRDGRYFLRTLSPVKDREGKAKAITVVSKDITEQKQIEYEYEHLVKELEAKNRELERFTYTVSHELGSPLFAIRGFSSILRDDLEQGRIENLENALKRIENAAKKMGLLLNDTLELSRIGRVADPPEDVPFGKIVEEALEQTAEQIRSRGAEVSVAEDFPIVHVDRMRLVEVLVNLITNSVKYSGEQPNPEIEFGHRIDNGEEVVFFVKDNGIGIEKSQHEKVFELFYRLDKSGTGTGAGLAIVKQIIEVHEGRVWIESEKGRGCTVCFTLPLQ